VPSKGGRLLRVSGTEFHPAGILRIEFPQNTIPLEKNSHLVWEATDNWPRYFMEKILSVADVSFMGR